MNHLATIDANHHEQSACCEYIEVTATHTENYQLSQRTFIMEKVLTNDFNGYDGYAQYMRNHRVGKIDSPDFRNSKTCEKKMSKRNPYSIKITN